MNNLEAVSGKAVDEAFSKLPLTSRIILSFGVRFIEGTKAKSEEV